MEQRVPARSWTSPGVAGHRPRLLVEDDDPVMAISDFSVFRQAGFEVAFCSGPDPGEPCPLLSGRDCDVVARADVVLHALDPHSGIAAAIRRLHPGVEVVVKLRGAGDGDRADVPEGCAALGPTAPVEAQVRACRHALTVRRG